MNMSVILLTLFCKVVISSHSRHRTVYDVPIQPRRSATNQTKQTVTKKKEGVSSDFAIFMNRSVFINSYKQVTTCEE